MNILFVMYDQLRFDYLSCAGHAALETPNFDRVAARGVRFTRAYVQSPICGASRMSFYTGRYVSSHGAQWNGFPLRVGEVTLGDHLREAGMNCWLLGKTHMKADAKGMARLGLSPDSVIGARQADCGFDAWARDDGLWGTGPDGDYDQKRSPYNEYLKARGYDGDNPWADYANAGVDDGQIASGWMFMNADKPANIREEDSETPWLTSETIRFIEAAEGPWCAHVSFIKPHWPYIVPAPYHDMYGPEDVVPPVRAESERDNPHPIFGDYQKKRVSQAFSRDEVRDTVIPAYMGLIGQLDDEIGRLLKYLDDTGQRDTTMIVLTSDHGDYLGDHWMGEKELFHDCSSRVPLIVVDPRAEADTTRGTVSDALVEAIDLVPTFVQAAGGQPRYEVLEGRSLIGHLHGQQGPWRDHVISEYDYDFKSTRLSLDQPIGECRLAMIFDGRYKLMHAEGFRPMLHDLAADPQELHDLGEDTTHVKTRARLMDRLNAWYRRHHSRTTISDAEIARRAGGDMKKGIFLGFWDEAELAAARKAGVSGN